MYIRYITLTKAINNNSGTPWIDYLVASSDLIPANNMRYYSEKLILLSQYAFFPYQPLFSKQENNDKIASKELLGFPKDAFIFGYFDTTRKLTPSLFQSWMKILQQVPGIIFVKSII